MSESSQIISGIVVAVLVFLASGLFIVLLVAFINQKKRQHAKETELIQSRFNSELLQSQIEIQEHTFNQISEELHDNVGQLLSLVSVQLNILETDPAGNKLILQAAKDNVRQIMSDLRGMAKSLSSERIRSTSIVSVIQRELEQLGKAAAPKFETAVTGSERFVEEKKKIIAFRFVQESLNNCLKHAAASAVTVHVAYADDGFSIEVSDNGKGFDPDQLTNAEDGLGLLNIRKRAALVNGHCSIASSPGEGTAVKLVIPYD
jgi:two-component system, NarL family, sensor kinase